MKPIDDGCCPVCGAPRTHDTSIIEAGPVRLQAGVVTKGHLSIAITGTQFRVLAVYARRAGKPVSRDSVMLQVWGDDDDPPNEKIVDTILHHLRAALGHDAFETRFGGIKIFHPERVRLNPDRAQSASEPTPDVIRRWTPAEDARLAELVAEGKRDTEIARLMGRTADAIRDRRRRALRKRKGTRGWNGFPRWTADEDATLREMFETNHGDREIGALLGRNWASVRERRRRLGLVRSRGWHWKHREAA